MGLIVPMACLWLVCGCWGALGILEDLQEGACSTGMLKQLGGWKQGGIIQEMERRTNLEKRLTAVSWANL